MWRDIINVYGMDADRRYQLAKRLIREDTDRVLSLRRPPTIYGVEVGHVIEYLGTAQQVAEHLGSTKRSVITRSGEQYHKKYGNRGGCVIRRLSQKSLGKNTKTLEERFGPDGVETLALNLARVIDSRETVKRLGISRTRLVGYKRRIRDETKITSSRVPLSEELSGWEYGTVMRCAEGKISEGCAQDMLAVDNAELRGYLHRARLELASREVALA